ncbi:pleckstrin homology-like domain family B member 2, partial [Mustelus asterias]
MIDLAMGLGVELGGQNNGPSTASVSRDTPITDCRSIACVSLDNADDVTSRNNMKNLLNGGSDRFRQGLPVSGEDTSRLDGKPCQTGAQKSQTSLCLTDLERLREEFEQEMEVELALVQGELVAECTELEREQRNKEALCTRIAGLGQALEAEKEKEKAKVDCGRRKMEEARARLRASQRWFEDQAESAKEQLREQLQEEAEAVELAQRNFEDLEFQCLEKVSRLEEERETQNLQLERELEQCGQREADRKV